MLSHNLEISGKSKAWITTKGFVAATIIASVFFAWFSFLSWNYERGRNTSYDFIITSTMSISYIFAWVLFAKTTWRNQAENGEGVLSNNTDDRLKQ